MAYNECMQLINGQLLQFGAPDSNCDVIADDAAIVNVDEILGFGIEPGYVIEPDGKITLLEVSLVKH